MPDHELSAYGDKELWYVTGSVPEGDWSLPIYIYRYRCDQRQFVRIAPILALPAQSTKLKELFESVSIWSQNGQYMVETELFEAKAHKAPGVTPDCYRHWPGIESQVPTAYQVQVQASDEPEPENEAGRFLDHVHRQTGVSRKLLKMAWWSMAEAAPQWLLSEHKPIDLGYAMIYPVPYRANWKETLLQQDPTVGTAFKTAPDQRERELHNRGFIARLAQGELLAVDSLTHRFHWSLEVVPSKSFEQRAEQVEITQLKLGTNRYIERYEKILAKLLPTILLVFSSWLSKIAFPLAKIRAGSYRGTRRLVPTRRSGASTTPRSPKRLPSTVTPPPDTCGGARLETRICKKTTRLPEMPDIQQDSPDVWYSNEGRSGPGGNMDQPKNGGTTTTGVSLLSSGENEG